MPVRHAPRLIPIGPRSSEHNSPLTLAAMKGRQRAKIREFRNALAAAGLRSLDEQAAVLMLSRSTTWTLLKGKHKGSGISATIINRMLVAPQLPPPVRATILQYVAEKTAGLYGDSDRRLRKFTAQLSVSVLDHAAYSGTGRRKRSTAQRRTGDASPASREQSRASQK
jgi:hypothetical protein